MLLSDQNRSLKIRTNAEQNKDVLKAVEFGCEGIGLCRTEHMFFNPKRIQFVRLMILAQNEQDRKKALSKLLPYQKNDFYKIMKNISPLPVTIRLLDPPLHEFLDLKKQDIVELAEITGLSKQQIKNQTELINEVNPMLGHRGCRLGVSYPEITKMQATAIIKASIKLLNEGIKVFPEIMVPLVGSINEFINQKNIITEVFQDALKNEKVKIKYLIGTMIELPRACIIADKIAEHADFISFGTNDLTQTCFGFSRDDIGGFLPHYLSKKILTQDPFESLDIDGVGSLINIAVKKAREVNKNIKIGVCGEHGGDEKSIYFFNQKDFDYVSCSPYRVPIARLAAAKAKHLKL
jgi:pyruvate,orthophosphate dikinase